MAQPKPDTARDRPGIEAPAAKNGSTGRLPAVVVPPTVANAAGGWTTRRVWTTGTGIVIATLLAIGLYLKPWTSGAALVVTEVVAAAPVKRVLAVNGNIAARQSVDVRPLVSGAISDLRVTEGDVVEARSELARIGSAAQQALVRQAMAGLDAALVSQAQAQETFQRTQALGGTVPRTTLDASESAVQSAAQDVARATAQVDQAQVQLETFTLRAPITGTVLVVNVEPGQSIDPSTVLMTVADLDHLLVETGVDEAYAVQIQTGQPAVLQLAGETRLRDGVVSRVARKVDAATAGLAVQITFDQPVTAPIGLTVVANIVVDSQSAAITAPRTALLTDENGSFVFILQDGMAQRRAVSVIEWPAARLVVTDGLGAGDVLIIDASDIVAGQAVSTGEP